MDTVELCADLKFSTVTSILEIFLSQSICIQDNWESYERNFGGVGHSQREKLYLRPLHLPSGATILGPGLRSVLFFVVRLLRAVFRNRLDWKPSIWRFSQCNLIKLQ